MPNVLRSKVQQQLRSHLFGALLRTRHTYVTHPGNTKAQTLFLRDVCFIGFYYKVHTIRSGMVRSFRRADESSILVDCKAHGAQHWAWNATVCHPTKMVAAPTHFWSDQAQISLICHCMIIANHSNTSVWYRFGAPVRVYIISYSIIHLLVGAILWLNQCQSLGVTCGQWFMRC